MDSITPAEPELISLELTEHQRDIVIGALYDKLAETERYLRGSKPSDEPGPEDSCCDTHLARYQRNREIYVSLKGRKKAVKKAIALFESLEVRR